MTDAELQAQIDAIVAEETQEKLDDIQEFIDSGDLDKTIEEDVFEDEQ